ncbi:MAG: glucose-6-phosphate isomerase [Rickettsiales bacterium]|jgi:glucose-6-phosphate isomerase|nr:glucose-6-phosphate isomerase [Rickettsiales bacterium]
MNFTETSAYGQLKKHQAYLSDYKITDLFDQEPERAGEMSLALGDIMFDFSKNLVDKKALGFLVKMAEQAGLASAIEAMFAGKKINFTENRAVLHAALRNMDEDFTVDGRNVSLDIRETFAATSEFAERVRDGRFTGAKKGRILDVVNIGIGGSFLGPKMAIHALLPYKSPLVNFHFISNVDGTDTAEVLRRLEPESTLFIVSSKTFTTDETMTNAATCRNWIIEKLGASAVAHHFAAISTNARLANEFGIPTAQVFPFGDYVGGRYSMWGPIGLAIMIAIGTANFKAMLAGAAEADRHFRSTDFRQNIPIIMALMEIWNANFLGMDTLAVLPYDHYLAYLPSYLQQLVMESNGKYVGRDGMPVKYQTSPVLFGEEGTNGQHSFYQLIHQGTKPMMCDFIIPALSHNELGEHHIKLVANGIAQAEALMRGRAADSPELAGDLLAPFKTFEGNRPSNTFLVRKITPASLGMLVALYEHKTFAEGVMWDINSFDQFGVELGKKLASAVVADLKSADIAAHDSSTTALIAAVKEIRKSV